MVGLAATCSFYDRKNEVKFAARLLLFLIEFCHLAK